MMKLPGSMDQSLLLFALVPVVWIALFERRKKNDSRNTVNDSTTTKNDTTTKKKPSVTLGELDIRRKSQIATGRAMDHRHDTMLYRINDLDLSKTIFSSVKSPMARYMLRQQFGWYPMWSDASVARILALYNEQVPDSHPPIPPEILRFMNEECDFRVEHADGSFMDHLRWCHDFTHCWYKSDALGCDCAPLVLLLHSITGVGTNFFPMKASSLPKLEALLPSAAFKQVVAFPTFLRFLKQRSFIRDLQASSNLSQIQSVTLHRVIDNKPMTLTSDEMWVALNYQLIHSLDFLPLTHLGHAKKQFPNGSYHSDSAFLSEYHELYNLLQSKNKLFVNIQPIQLLSEELTDCPPWNFYSFVKSMLSPKLVSDTVEKLTFKSIQRFSDAIGHSLTYEFSYVEKKDDSS
mmetsp:Transcript_9676/g.14361  ORF Transcript_9676/g.14361 Transcript_9676/m.14361 type:complete len:405 (-) Transcript_9676:852-2066(-)